VDEKAQKFVKLTYFAAITVWIHFCSDAESDLSGQGEPRGEVEVA
jgi:hypothetical protein